MLKDVMLQHAFNENVLQEIQHSCYRKECLNMSSSDAAGVILKNLSLLSDLQQTDVEGFPESIQEKLFAVLGFQKESGRNARVLLEAKGLSHPMRIPSGQRFRAGNLSFETNKDVILRKNSISGIYTKFENSINDFSYLLDEEYPLGGTIFTQSPKEGMEIYFILDDLADAGEELIFYVRLAKEHHNPVFENKNIFSHIQWQIYTQKGFMNIRCKDSTGSFLTSGELSFRIPKEKVLIYQDLPKQGYAIRGILRKADYDFIPKIKSITGFLFEVWQKETKSVCYTYSGKKQSIDLYSNIPKDGMMQVFCKEENSDEFYLYQESKDSNKTGRYYFLEKQGDGRYRIVFEAETFGYAPAKSESAIKLVLYDSEMMKNSKLGILYGYDYQKITLPAKQIVKESFSLIIEKEDETGEKKYYFIRPNSKKSNELYYCLNEKEGIIEIPDAGDFIDCVVYIAGCTITNGLDGNVREGCYFQPVGMDSQLIFVNPAMGKGGCNSEDVSQLRQRMMSDLKKQYVAVEAGDYENFVRGIPQLCIDKVKAVALKGKNKVCIAVKPKSDELFPKLSRIYEKEIRTCLEQARLLNVSIEIKQPVYVPVEIQGTVFIRSNLKTCQNQIEQLIQKHLNYISSNKNFGERFYFDQLFQEIENLESVKYIYDLTVSLPQREFVQQSGYDLLPDDDCLLYPKNMKLVLKNAE